ncbi:MAG: FAD:protein FMN transferase [Gammaproteobacteria bacterium]|nr:FAD:protein FMN transferase [Gammaproteobacteria bacterium]
MPDNKLQLNHLIDYYSASFLAMGSPCEVLIETDNASLALEIATLAHNEALRIEKKFSRYRDDNIVFTINQSKGKTIKVDAETAQLLDFADQCHQLSDGKFDITSGVLREIWKFDGSDKIPDPDTVFTLLSRIGWKKIKWNKPNITFAAGMEIDLGGIGKEYAVDHTAKLIQEKTDVSFLINYGGDIFANKARTNNTPWIIGIDNPSDQEHRAAITIKLFRGGLATSGDAHRYLLKDGIRYCHILDPTTGWPVPNAPRSVSVIADNCLEAGMLSTFAILQGDQAIPFLEAQEIQYWCI